jgi:asparagine synthase (glutamine-hydrolysing)
LGWRQTILHAEDYFDRQPLTGGGGSLRLVFDGRIDNRAALARTLAIFPEQARDWPDSAYALSAFEKWGPECVDKLLGDFAFAVWNERTRQLFLARDHIGAKPLYFYRGDRSFFMLLLPRRPQLFHVRIPAFGSVYKCQGSAGHRRQQPYSFPGVRSAGAWRDCVPGNRAGADRHWPARE